MQPNQGNGSKLYLRAIIRIDCGTKTGYEKSSIRCSQGSYESQLSHQAYFSKEQFRIWILGNIIFEFLILRCLFLFLLRKALSIDRNYWQAWLQHLSKHPGGNFEHSNLTLIRHQIVSRLIICYFKKCILCAYCLQIKYQHIFKFKWINLFILLMKETQLSCQLIFAGEWMSKPTLIDEFLSTIHMQNYCQTFKDYGVQTLEDLFLITPDQWAILKVLPFHRNKIIHSAASIKEQKVQAMQKNCISQNFLHQYKFSSNGPYHPSHVPQNLKNFEPEGYGLASTNSCFMKFTFQMPVNIYGMMIGNNVGVSGGWGHTYLEGVQVQVKQSNAQDYKTVHTINGMPNAVNTAYLAKIDSINVEEVRLWKTSYYSTFFVHFV